MMMVMMMIMIMMMVVMVFSRNIISRSCSPRWVMMKIIIVVVKDVGDFGNIAVELEDDL